MDDLDDIIKDFLIESYESLDQLDQDFVALEAEPDNSERLASVFRTVHTIKGTAGFFGFQRLERLTHVGENLLSKLRDGELRLTPPMASGLLAMVDTVREILAEIERSSSEPDADDSALLGELERLQGDDSTPAAAPAPVAAREPIAAVPSEVPEAPVAAPAPVAEPRPSGKLASVSASNVRVSVDLLDKLMDLVGELVLSRNQILQRVDATDDGALSSASQRLNLVTTELQQGVMKTRLQPIDTVWNKLPRVVRDLCETCGKQVRLEFEGKETELDRTIIEAIKDPLTHIVRNAIDHGVETPERRIASGKPAQGTLRLHAYHEGGQVNIEIADDGAGLDLERIRAKAVERRIVSKEAVERMSDHDAANLVFWPGFSTAAAVTNVSGRGVGMDVVRTKIEDIGGAVELSSERGAGTTLKIKIPLTLAIIPVLDIRHGGERFAIPQVSVAELVRLNSGDASRTVERIGEAPVYRLRGKLLPLVFLDDLLRLGETSTDGSMVIVVLHAGRRRFGLVVADVNDTEEIVVKPLHGALKQLGCYSGATILGDGSVALILDAIGIAARAELLATTTKQELAIQQENRAVGAEESEALLCFSVGNPSPMAIPLELVDRLEEFRPDAPERVGRSLVVQHRGEILPLVDLREMFCTGAAEEEDLPTTIQVIVCTHRGQQAGLVVSKIVDVTDAPAKPRGAPSRHGVSATCITHDKVTEIVHVETVFQDAGIVFVDAARELVA